MLSFKRNGAPFLWNGCADFAEYAITFVNYALYIIKALLFTLPFQI